MAKFKKYNGKDKYHFRYYRKSVYHPFLVIMVTEEIEKEGKYTITGFSLTHSAEMVLKRPSKFVRFSKNPNPEDNEPSYFCIDIKTDKSKYFSEPLKKWHLYKKDEQLIDELIKRKKK